jgi:hypothetical protein
MYNITLQPAYGKDYKSKAEVLAAWLADHDFIIATKDIPYSGKPMNRPQATDNAYAIRYNNNRKIVIVKKKGDTWTC